MSTFELLLKTDISMWIILLRTVVLSSHTAFATATRTGSRSYSFSQLWSANGIETRVYFLCCLRVWKNRQVRRRRLIYNEGIGITPLTCLSCVLISCCFLCVTDIYNAVQDALAHFFVDFHRSNSNTWYCPLRRPAAGRHKVCLRPVSSLDHFIGCFTISCLNDKITLGKVSRWFYLK